MRIQKKKNGVHKLLWLLSEKWRNFFNRWVVTTNLSRIMLQTSSKDMVCSFHRPLRSANGNGSAYLKSNAVPLKWKGRPTWCPLSLASSIKSHVHLDIFIFKFKSSLLEGFYLFYLFWPRVPEEMCSYYQVRESFLCKQRSVIFFSEDRLQKPGVLLETRDGVRYMPRV